MDVTTVRIIMTVVSFAVFLGIVAFAVYPGNKRRFEEAALLPINDEEARP